MEISPTTSNAKVSNHIPDDLVNSILYKLPIKSLKHFECVCKSWSHLIIDSYFMTVYRNYLLSKDHSFYDDTSILLHSTKKVKYDLYSLSGERFENKVKLDWPKVPLHPSVRGVKIKHSIHDISKDNVPPSRVGDFSFEILRPISINGTLCLEYPEIPDINDHTKLILWNPTTKEFKVIYLHKSNHLSDVWAHHYQFGYDHVKNDYKMI
ncbi:putative F-box protein At3g16210 [Trifolium pratense]|uniref:putative F-box protein At3g16210 n=1 Tax=Trifolium pratense TaxID=57577 RepID=UPI001E694DC2|nr:putative F-box protein At3g16210 [Trifolium pratense]